MINLSVFVKKFTTRAMCIIILSCAYKRFSIAQCTFIIYGLYSWLIRAHTFMTATCNTKNHTWEYDYKYTFYDLQGATLSHLKTINLMLTFFGCIARVVRTKLKCTDRRNSTSQPCKTRALFLQDPDAPFPVIYENLGLPIIKYMVTGGAVFALFTS